MTRRVDVLMLCGDAGHGKDAAAQAFTDMGYKRYAFADALKECAAAAMRLPVADFHDPEKKNKALPLFPKHTHRELLELLGTEFFRTRFPGVWHRGLADEIWRNKDEKVVISDLRFPDELAYFDNFFGVANVTVFQVFRPFVDATPHVSECRAAGLHESKWAYKLIPPLRRNLIVNDSDLTGLREAARMKLQQTKGL
jgi:hypothetical protein